MATPYMGMTIPVPSVTPGPLWASELVTAFNIIDGHDHGPNGGRQLATGALASGTAVLSTGSTTARTLGARFADFTYVADFGAVGDGTTDDTVAINAALVAGTGKTVIFEDNLTYIISASLKVFSGTTMIGRATIKVKNGAHMVGNGTFVIGDGAAMLQGLTVTNVTIRNLEFNANYDNDGAYYGVTFSLGSGHTVEGCNIHDTGQAGVWVDTSSNFTLKKSLLKNCGRTIGGGTNDHACMVGSLTAAMTNFLADGNEIDTANRKGITTYCFTTGSFTNVRVTNNYVHGCKLGGIFLASFQVAVGTFKSVVVANNYLTGNYSNIEIDGADDVAVTGNVSISPTDRYCFSGTGLRSATISGNTFRLSALHGLLLDGGADQGGNSSKVVIVGNAVVDSNSSGNVGGVGIVLNNTDSSIVQNNIINDSTGKQVYCVSEGAGSSANLIRYNTLVGFTSGTAVLTTSATTYTDQTINLPSYPDGTQTILGNRIAASTSTDVVLGSTVTRTGGNLVDIQNNTASRWTCQRSGTTIQQGNAQFAGSSPVIQATASNQTVSILGNRNAADTGSEVIAQSTATRTAGALFTASNNGTLERSIGWAGQDVYPQRGDSTGAPGSATINQAAGRSTIASGTATITITNNLVTTTTGCKAWIQTADATATFIKSIVPGSGSFVVTVNANATGNTNIYWEVAN